VLCMSHRQRLVTLVRVAKQLDAADQYILQHVAPHDLVITADIPLAASVIAKNAVTLDPRSEVYTPENISERLAAEGRPRCLWGLFGHRQQVPLRRR
jgi:uncharacterized protein YaiI (UPF0178 family)